MATRVGDLARSYWEGALRAAPRRATVLGDHRFDDRLDDPGPGAKAAEVARLEGLLASISESKPVDAADELTLAALRLQVENDRSLLACDLEEWSLDPEDGPPASLLDLADYQPDDEALVARWRAVGPHLDAVVANLRRGAARGRFAPRVAVVRVLEQLDRALAAPVPDGAVRHARGAFERLRAFVRDELLPRARGPEAAGLLHQEGGLDVYRRLVRVHTSLDATPEKIHALGLREVARARGELSALGRDVLGAGDLAALRARVAADPSLSFTTAAEVLAHAEETVRRAETAARSVFGRLPRTACRVEAVAPDEEGAASLAYYLEPAADGSRPGTYRVNTARPTERLRFEAEALAFHEAIPGHHVQLALAKELEALPEFRKHASFTAYVEGWALYSERLASELGLYSSDLDRLGMLSFDAWRSARLVVDTGLHALGWSRDRAAAFLAANTLLPPATIAEEVDRYTVWPAQALAYKLGQLELLALREAARSALGAAFDLAAFHDRVLEEGALGLALLRARIEAWISRSGR